MSSLQPLPRLFKSTDLEMTDEARKIYGFFNEDINDFIKFDPDFGDSFAPAWLKAIEDAESLQSKDSLDAEQKSLTQAVEDKMKGCRNKFQSSKYFIEKAFPNNKIVWDEFGYKKYDAVRNYQIQMKEFMRNFYRTASKYSAKLIEVKYSAESIAEINTLLKDLVDADAAQEDFKNGRPMLTQDKVGKLNLCYSTTSKAANVGKQIFASDYAKHKRYVLSSEPVLAPVTPPANPNNPPA
ncbi:MAG: hypothetical protein M1480_00540 [Bacteroidetes bacterium]|nr:hypothetical protein [Bacteroidota bacterium]